MLPTFLAARIAASQTGGKPSSIDDSTRPTVDYAGKPRPSSAGGKGHNGQ
jgi:hypothetical protein